MIVNPYWIAVIVVSSLLIVAPVATAQDAEARLDLSTSEREILLEGVHAHDRGAFSEARRHYRRVLDQRPDHPVALYQIAFAYQAEGRLDECTEYASRSAAQTSVVQAQALGMQGACLDIMGRHREALAVFEDAIRKYPHFTQLRHSAAITQISLGDVDAAIDTLIDAIEADPTHPGSHLLLADIRLDQGQRVQALLGMSYFLLLERYSDRALIAIDAIQSILEPPPAEEGADGRRHLELLIPAGDDDELTTMESVLSLSSAVRDALAREQGTLVSEQIAGQVEMVFAALPEPRDPKSTRDPVWTLYIPFFSELHAQEHTRTFVYLALESSGLEGIDTWLTFNEDAVDSFVEWLDE